MSFVTAAPEFVTAAAGDLASIGSVLGAANAAAAPSTTGVVAAAADEVSTGIAAMFGTYAQQYQALSAQAEAFHNEFVSLLNGGAAAYISTEVANAEQTLSNAVNAPATAGANFAANAAASTPSLLGGGSTTSNSLLGGVGSLLGSGTATTSILGGLSSVLGGGSTTSLLGGLPTLSSLIGPLNLNLGDLTPGITLTSGPFAPLGPTLNGIGLDLGNFLSNELVNGITPSNLESLTTGLFQDVPALQGLQPLLQSLLPGLFGQPSSGAVAPYPNPYQVLGETTVINLNYMGSTYMDHPFPILNQIYTNQNHYAGIFWNGVAVDLQGFPANVPANVQLAIQGASTFNPAAMGQLFVNGTSGYWGTVGTSLQQFGSAIQGTLPTFEYQMGLAGTAISTGDYYGAVQDGAHGVIDLFISGFNTSQLGISGSLDFLTLGATVTIAGPIGLLGPAGDLLPILTATGQQAQGLVSLTPAGSIVAQMAQNNANGISTLTDSSVTADFALTVAALSPTPGVTLGGDAFFGLPLQLGFAVLGPPFAALNGLATGATAFSTALQAGNALGALNAIGDTPAYVLNGFLNGQVLVQEPLPVTVTVINLPSIVTANVTLPATANLPLDGLLVPPQPITATVDLSALGITGPITTTLGGTEFGGLLPFLVNTMPDQFAAAISYQNS
ncbi:MAG TPA: PE family protein [Mycobacterium sp.]|nr:PE family protein [Mycobacterium sp.]HUH69517.1 PE family protein [Mycobacterium sp.]